jgi:hypothetical protein
MFTVRIATMTRRRLLLFTMFVIAMVAIGVWLLWPQESPSEINQENAERIHTGMKLAEVEALLGGSARREANGTIEPNYEQFATVQELDDHLRTSMSLGNRGAKLWRSNRAMIWVQFDADERVIQITWCPARYRRVSPIDMIRRWVGLE